MLRHAKVQWVCVSVSYREFYAIAKVQIEKKIDFAKISHLLLSAVVQPEAGRLPKRKDH